MNELGLSKHDSKSLNEIPKIEFDYIITMGYGDTCPWVPAKNRVDCLSLIREIWRKENSMK
jgi:arsenate reductase